MADPLASVLVLENLHKKFGALVATNGVNLDIRQGELHALIGPNGAGKSTLIAQICGEIRPDSGRILFGGQDITSLPAYQRARMGMGRSFQLTQLCADFTAMENVLLSLEAKGGGSIDIFRNPRRNAVHREMAQTWLERAGLGDQADRVVSNMAHGQRRQLEIAVALARHPRLILLDEPMAGMGSEESASLTALLQDLKREYPILLIEHDMDAVFALADRISVLVYGKVIFTGTASEIRAHPEVRAAYLGEEA
ncbi:ABC transporter ATP-binding protein [Rhizobium lusitanum]|uniref:Branched-chain amino acid transport system ATP-binding protein n=1 Tax=Rhizobium lusitanum TaxID=293958 RepID=A0A7X0ITE0_9HYPH|nr:ABC transporter ATP-binding protein [Rhizobium lusitanum]MBB6486843.1 branched-chain amino acid transport system ATP-binding protein [Rhizobium lusitanum]